MNKSKILADDSLSIAKTIFIIFCLKPPEFGRNLHFYANDLFPGTRAKIVRLSSIVNPNDLLQGENCIALGLRGSLACF